jgi:hypothetical protein
MRRALVLSSTIALLTACSSGVGSSNPPGPFSSESAASSPRFSISGGAVSPAKARLGKVLTSAHRGQIFGFDVDQNGSDGLLSESQSGGGKPAIETFNLKTAKVTKIVKTLAANPNDDFVTFGIVGNDVGFVDEQRVRLSPESRHDRFFLLNPVSGEKITARWEPPHVTNSVLYQQAENQSTDTQVSVVFRNAFSSDVPWLYVWNSATNKFLNFIRLTRTGEQMAEDTSTNEAVLAAQSGSGTPTITLVNLKSGKLKTFAGLNNGPYGAGATNGLAVDSHTGIACTTTELNAQVEFYDLAKETGVAVQLPNTGSGSQFNSGSAIANDSEDGLFLVAQPNSSTGGNSAIYVYDETGDLIETLDGFDFSTSYLPPVKIAVNPGLRLGMVNGPNADQLQQFFY